MTGRPAYPVLAVLLLVAAAVECARPEADASRAPTPSSVDSALTVLGRRVPPALLNRYVAGKVGFTSRGGEMRCAYVLLGVTGDRVFVNTLCLELVRDGDSLAAGSGRAGPVALRFAFERDSVRIVSHEVPADGNRHAASIRRIFPPEVAERIFARAGERGWRLEYYLRGEAAARHGLRPAS
jgi:hypothetical protein